MIALEYSLRRSLVYNVPISIVDGDMVAHHRRLITVDIVYTYLVYILIFVNS